MKQDFQSFRSSFSRFIQTAPHWQLKQISKDLSATTKERFIRQTPRKCELVEKAFTDEEFLRFMAVVDDPLDRACFLFMATLGLRIGELAQLRGRDLCGEELRIHSSKGSYSATLRIPDALRKLLKKRDPDELLFGITSKELRDHFARYRKKAGLDEVYCRTEPRGRKNLTLPRYRLSTHSLRHYAIQRIYHETKDPDLARRFARHKKLQTTLGYFSSSRKEELEQLLERLPQFTFSPCGNEGLARSGSPGPDLKIEPRKKKINLRDRANTFFRSICGN